MKITEEKKTQMQICKKTDAGVLFAFLSLSSVQPFFFLFLASSAIHRSVLPDFEGQKDLVSSGGVVALELRGNSRDLGLQVLVGSINLGLVLDQEGAEDAGVDGGGTLEVRSSMKKKVTD